MKKAVAYLLPYIKEEKDSIQETAGKILLATVKGDVHDIGKNIVGVVLGCNNYEIIDLGVMVPPEKIIETAIEKQVDIIGLSGLITPSLDEMVYVAQELERTNSSVPLLIGGATTSRAHTAVKIDPAYNHSVVHVNDASRAVTVVSQLLQKDQETDYRQSVKDDYATFRENFQKRKESKTYIPLLDAREQKFNVDWDANPPVRPKQLGVQVIDQQDLSVLVDYIDWSPFFRSWDLHGKYPDILNDEVVGEQAKSLFEDAQLLLQQIIGGNRLTAKAVFGLFPVNSNTADEIEIYADENRKEPVHKFISLRQQGKKAQGKPYFALADFVAPKGIDDYAGCFCVTAGFGSDAFAKRFEDNNDMYNNIMVKALADRLAEAFAEYLHKKVRIEHWGYQPDEQFSNEALIQEKYCGIRPAPGYPACPDHLEKNTIWDLLDVSNVIGVTLTESLAMWPAASVSGYYFAHPEARYFGLGKMEKDQLIDYSQRRNIGLDEAEKWLRPNLNE
jgi:5-methyltetrahydrofolate--homocysteine methyltransferase